MLCWAALVANRTYATGTVGSLFNSIYVLLSSGGLRRYCGNRLRGKGEGGPFKGRYFVFGHFLDISADA